MTVSVAPVKAVAYKISHTACVAWSFRVITSTDPAGMDDGSPAVLESVIVVSPEETGDASCVLMLLAKTKVVIWRPYEMAICPALFQSWPVLDGLESGRFPPPSASK